jgi:hypothetical protein
LKRPLYLLLSALALASAFFALNRYSSTHLSDPDRLYHLALSREAVESGQLYLKTLPQAEGLGWNEYFPDKEFLFHQLTNLGYRLGGEAGVVGIALLCSVLAAVSFFLFGAGRIPLLPALQVTIVTFFVPVLLFRLQMLRPHVAAIMFFVLLNVAILRKNRWGAAAGGLLFALSYHAVYIPLICLGALAVSAFAAARAERKVLLKVAGWGLGGVGAGILLNPYFPSNLVAAWEIARIPSLMQGELGQAQFGNELYPVPSNVFFHLFLLPMLVAAAGVLAAGGKLLQWQRNGSTDWRWAYLVPLTLFFLALCFQNRRAAEYLLPVSGFLLVLLLEQVKRWDWRSITASFALLAAFAGYYGKELVDAALAPVRPWVYESATAVRAIPPQPEAKVFNCEWDKAPYLLYYRPDLRFIDLLDPSLLYFHRPDVFASREALRLGQVADASGLIQSAFAADFVLCVNPDVVRQLEFDPGFRRLYPEPAAQVVEAVPYVFEVRKGQDAAYVRKFSVRRIHSSRKGFFMKSPQDAEGEERQLELEKTTFLNLSALFAEEAGPDDALCALVEPEQTELTRLAGAGYLVLGGGRNLRLWLNGEPLYASEGGFQRAQNAQVVVPLPRPLRASDRIGLVACSASDAPFWGAALSLWKEGELADRCAWKSGGQSGAPWVFKGSERISCLGPMAAASPPAALTPVSRLP